MPNSLANLTSKEISLALLALHQQWTKPPEELKHLTIVEWSLLEGLLNQLLEQKETSVMH